MRGLSRRQTVTALNIAKISQVDFEMLVERETPLSVTGLVKKSRKWIRANTIRKKIIFSGRIVNMDETEELVATFMDTWDIIVASPKAAVALDRICAVPEVAAEFKKRVCGAAVRGNRTRH
jgi:hypothetical protein